MTTPHRHPGGFALLYIIAVITFAAVIVTGLIALTSKPVVYQSQVNYQNQAVNLALSGLSYVQNQNFELTQSTGGNSALSTLNGFNYTPTGGNGTFNLQVAQSGSNWQIKSTGATTGGVAQSYTAFKTIAFVAANPPPPTFPPASFLFNDPNANYTAGNNANQSGNIVALNVTLGNNAIFKGSICAYGNIAINNNVQAQTLNGNTCNVIYAQADIFVAQNVTIGSASSPFIMCANGDITINNNAAVYATIYAQGNVSISNNAQVTGSIIYKGSYSNSGTLIGTATNRPTLGACPNCN